MSMLIVVPLLSVKGQHWLPDVGQIQTLKLNLEHVWYEPLLMKQSNRPVCQQQLVVRDGSVGLAIGVRKFATGEGR